MTGGVQRNKSTCGIDVRPFRRRTSGPISSIPHEVVAGAEAAPRSGSEEGLHFQAVHCTLLTDSMRDKCKWVWKIHKRCAVGPVVGPYKRGDHRPTRTSASPHHIYPTMSSSIASTSAQLKGSPPSPATSPSPVASAHPSTLAQLNGSPPRPTISARIEAADSIFII